MSRVPAVFLDRDDTVIRNVPYCDDPEKVELMPGAGSAIRRLNDADLPVVIVTNQSGIARGYFTPSRLEEIHQRMNEMLKAHGARVDAIYHCPHHPADGCNCRKPETEMFETAARDHDLHLERSYMVGDRIMDIEAARRVGARGVLIPSHTGRWEHARLPLDPDYLASDLPDAVDWILAHDKARPPLSHRGARG